MTLNSSYKVFFLVFLKFTLLNLNLKKKMLVFFFLIITVLVSIWLKNLDFILQKVMQNSYLHVYTYQVYTLSQSDSDNDIKGTETSQEVWEIVHMPFLI